MSARLIRALERGGIASQIERDAWGIWRGRDRRCRMIGKLSGAQVDLLRMQKSLAPLGEEVPPILIWTGPQQSSETPASNGTALERILVDGRGSLLQHIISKCRDPALRRSYRRAAQGYLLDIEQIEQPERSPGMNWNALALGGRIDGGRFSTDLKISKEQAPARARLSKLKHRLPAEDLSLLDGMVLRDETRSALARRFATRPSIIERRALSVLRALSSVYD